MVAIEKAWIPTILRTTLYIYELPTDHFTLLDEAAGYYIFYKSIRPISIRPVRNILSELLERNIEVRIIPSLLSLADEVSRSNLHFSNIRIRNAALKNYG